MISAGLLTATLAIGGFQAAGYGSNHQDLSPKYSGILFGLSNASASSAGALAVFITGQSMCTPATLAVPQNICWSDTEMKSGDTVLCQTRCVT